ncbi:hypothetical protein G7062_04160 [Erysipelothrix sp. HDW6C]|uniref:PHP domain-containing protein n=1 Tax=Erysipelothrix sp. HDW6C TaxID=2714930 RepID=UPI001409D739|nr:hypothetical protein [Erysipelothrix sp. HDW6C]QIK69538.1 hypothetical protein G7062_04160 [Erysipelothrix sp. HDW6C]
MNNIVKRMVKLDLHIHSAASIGKDGDKVKDNTIDNLPVLYQRLENEEVELISITDHNNFDLAMFDRIRSDIELEKTGTLKKILPGIEFDVEIENSKIHVISIFNDLNYENIKCIPEKLKKYTFDNESKKAFKESTFKNILSDLNLDVVLIAHQKSDVRAKIHNDNLSNVGEKLFDNFIALDYFDAVEFRSGKVEGMLRNYKVEHELENLRFITGTDCHVWSVYPDQDMTRQSEIKFTYMKSLCSFKGLVMALTEPKRLSTANLSIHPPHIKELSIDLSGEKVMINLASGINVIIGDNSIGKSLIVEKLFNKDYLSSSKTLKDGHDKYLKSKEMSLNIVAGLDEIQYLYKRQGGIRGDFQSDKNLKDIDFFSNKFIDLDNAAVSGEIDRYADKVIERMKQNHSIMTKNNSLNFTINIPSDVEENYYYLSILNDLKQDEASYESILVKIETILNNLSDLREEKLFESNKELDQIVGEMKKLQHIYKSKKRDTETKNRVINIINLKSRHFNSHYTLQKQGQEAQLTKYNDEKILVINKVVEAVKINSEKLIDPLQDFEEIVLSPLMNEIGEYTFVTKRIYDQIDKETMIKILMSPIKYCSYENLLLSINTDTFESKFKETETRKHNGTNVDKFELYKAITKDYYLREILAGDLLINKNNLELLTGNSPGKNALIYLDILSQDDLHQLIVIDQPGDDVAQNRVASELVAIFRSMVDNNKQVIIVTHKPELVVNLDVDNVIILKQTNNGNIEIHNGALEFENEQINVLAEVANTLDGGVETIRKRWKRYDKKSD